MPPRSPRCSAKRSSGCFRTISGYGWTRRAGSASSGVESGFRWTTESRCCSTRSTISMHRPQNLQRMQTTHLRMFRGSAHRRTRGCERTRLARRRRSRRPGIADAESNRPAALGRSRAVRRADRRSRAEVCTPCAEVFRRQARRTTRHVAGSDSRADNSRRAARPPRCPPEGRRSGRVRSRRRGSARAAARRRSVRHRPRGLERDRGAGERGHSGDASRRLLGVPRRVGSRRDRIRVGDRSGAAEPDDHSDSHGPDTIGGARMRPRRSPLAGRASPRVADRDEFVATLEKYERGELTPEQWRAFRLVRGTYGQRQAEDAQMLRIKIPQGVLTADQLDALADVAERHSRGFGHITTRQNVQFHFVKLHDVEPAMRRLAETGLTTREACGNSVRNITGCPYAGVSADERFDVSPYAEGLTRFLLRHPLSSTLPRKFKIAFEGCSTEHVMIGINDLGFRAQLGPDGGRGFRVTAGGGTSIMVTNAGVLHDFLPASEILRVAEAVLRVFKRLGDYQHKQRNRMKFLIKTLGWTRWREEYDRELTAARLRGQVPTLEIDPPANESRPEWVKDSSPSVGQIVSRVSAGRISGPGLTPNIVPVL